MSVGYPDWGGSPALAQAITAITVPSFTLAPGGIHSWQGQITRLGYEIEVGASQLAATAQSSPVNVQMVWQDSVSHAVTAIQSWWLFPGTNLTGHHFVLGQGPSAGNLLTVTITNANGAGPSVDIFLLVQDVARIYDRHDWRSRDDLFPSFQNYNTIDHDLHAGVLAGVVNVAVAANSSVVFLLPLFSGEFQIKQFITSTAALNVLVETQAFSDANLNGTTFEASSAGSATLMSTGYLPRCQCQLKLQNTSSTVAGNVFLQMIVAENT